MHPSFSTPRPAVDWLLALILAAGLGACASAPNKAPIEDRKPGRPTAPAPAVAPATTSGESTGAATDAPKLLPGAENAGKPGYYSVKPGDTLIRIALDNGQNWREVARWNNIDKPNLIEVGQVLRVVPPGVDPAAVASRGVAPAKVELRPLDGKPAAAGGVAGAAAAAASAAAAVAPVPTVTALTPAAAKAESDDEPTWAWPAAGAVLAGFEEGRQKGLTINGKAGDPVFAAADGRVVYAGSGLRGYGNLVIVKHNNTYLTAYAHNQVLLVKEDQAVRRGQKIAGSRSAVAPGRCR